MHCSILKVTCLALVGVTAALVQPAERDSPLMQDISAKVRALPRDSFGYIHMADDGVIRSLDGCNEVLGHVRLPPEAIARYVQERSEILPEEKAHLEEVYEGVDGRSVDEVAAWNMAPELVSRLWHDKVKRDGEAACKRGPIIDRRQEYTRRMRAKRELGTPLERRWCPEAGHNCTLNRTPYCGYWSCDCSVADQASTGVCAEF
ncbi:hypothetical protein AB5N19_06805 [Seiridium cardinale]